MRLISNVEGNNNKFHINVRGYVCKCCVLPYAECGNDCLAKHTYTVTIMTLVLVHVVTGIMFCKIVIGVLPRCT